MRSLRRFPQHRGGGSAVEFAIIVPILAGLLISGFDAWQLINRKQDMHAAINAGAHYYMGGGADDPTAQAISLSGWPNRPGDAQVAISRACTCAGAGSSCTTVCAATQQAPEIRVTLTAQSQWTGLTPAALSESETVRVR
jgi:Flp pilus assembly protein TadG